MELTTKVLIQIRDELRAVREGQAEVKEQLAAVHHHMTEMDIRLSTEIVALRGAIDRVPEVIRKHVGVLANHERRINTLEGK